MFRKILFFIMLMFFSLPTFAMENAFYILRNLSPTQTPLDEHAFSSLTTHYRSIDILISQAYRIRQDGAVAGFIPAHILEFTKEHHVKVLALITNAAFDKEIAHQFLSDIPAQKRALLSILTICQEQHLYGVQFDFEGISIKDKAALTHFYQQAYRLLHHHGFIVSFAVVPVVNDGKQPTDFLKRRYENWGGAYDLKTLGKYSDFITLMAYDQHLSGTTPGPVASIRWVEATIRYALRYIPAHKISLGIPTYSSYWYIRNSNQGKISVNSDNISYLEATHLLKKFHATLNWDDNNKTHYAFYERDWLNEYLFVEDLDSFRAKYALAEKYHLRGISAFNLGNEDPRIWGVVSS